LIPLKDNIPTRRFPVLTVAIIVACIVMYVGFQHGGLGGVDEENVVKYAAIPYEITHPGKQCVPAGAEAFQCASASRVEDAVGESLPPTWLTILTAMFMHGGLLHIAGNMLFLWIFGNNIEDSMGRGRFIAFYLLGGLAATLAQTAVDPSSSTPTLGASGAIAAVLGGYALLYPRARVVTLVFIIFFITVIELPALLVLGAWFALQILDASSQPATGGGVAYFAHIGGFLFGLALIRLFANRTHDDYHYANRLPVY
jgi:membrane associated rhomboid family serine protease